MDYITVVAPTYEEAVMKARKEYGDKVRIHSRKNLNKSGILGFGKSSCCELTCYLTDSESRNNSSQTKKESEATVEKEIKRFEEEAKTPNPEEVKKDEKILASFNVFEEAANDIKELMKKPLNDNADDSVPTGSEKKEYEKVHGIEVQLEKVRTILMENDFSLSFMDWMNSEIRGILETASPQVPSDEELEILVLDKIAESLKVDSMFASSPQRVVAVLGPVASGKTTMVAKLAAMYCSGNSPVRRNVRVVLLDDNPAVVNQLSRVGKALNISVRVALHENELTQALQSQLNNELIFIDGVGKQVKDSSTDYRMYGLMNVTSRSETRYLLTIPAGMKNYDIATVMEQYKQYPISGLLVTKLDETTTIGNIISVCHDNGLPVVFTSNGKKIPKDIEKASSYDLLKQLRGFSIDIGKIIDSEQ